MVGVHVCDDFRAQVESGSTEDTPSEIAPELAIVPTQGVHGVGIVSVQPRCIESEASYTPENWFVNTYMTICLCIHAPSPKPASRCIAVFRSN